MRKVGVFGKGALRIASMLDNLNLPCSQVSARDIATEDKCPEVLLVTAEKAVDALVEVKALRGHGFAGRIVVITNESQTEEDMIAFYLAGADNCIGEKVSRKMIYAMVFAAARIHVSKRESCERFEVGNLCLDTTARRITIGTTEVNFGPSGYEMLLVLLKRRGRVQTREEILEQIRPRTHLHIESRSVDVLLGRVRKQLQQHQCQGFTITTVRSAGYRLDVD